MATMEEALKKIDEGGHNIDSSEGEIAAFLRAWVKYEPERAAGLILEGEKDIKGALASMRTAAEKKKSGNTACIPPAEAAEIILEYFGHPEPKGVLEGGLMYAFMVANIERWKPYGADAPAEMKPADSEPTPKPRPAAGIDLDLDSLLA